MERIRIGVVGLGAIAQAIHLPNLVRLWDRFQIVHVCDVASTLADEIAASLGPGVRAAADPAAVFDDPSVDAVLLLASGPHAMASRAALEAGKHVFVEKPLALTILEATELDAIARGAGRVLQVGYMKLHDPVVAVAIRELRTIEDPRLVRITVVHPPEAIQQRHLTIRRGSVPADVIAEARRYEHEMTTRAVGALPPIFGWIYRDVGLGSLIHQVALARHLLGSLPDRVDTCRAWPLEVDADEASDGRRADPPSILALSEARPGLWLELDWVWAPDAAEYVERYEVFGRAARLELEMPTPYALDQRAHLRVDRSDAEERSGSIIMGDHRTGFQVELEAFHTAIAAGPPYPSDAPGAAADTAFVQGLVGALARQAGFSPAGEAASR